MEKYVGIERRRNPERRALERIDALWCFYLDSDEFPRTRAKLVEWLLAFGQVP